MIWVDLRCHAYYNKHRVEVKVIGMIRVMLLKKQS